MKASQGYEGEKVQRQPHSSFKMQKIHGRSLKKGKIVNSSPKQSQQESQKFLAHCYNVISEQQAHIQKLEQTITKKENLILNLLNKKERQGRQKDEINNAEFHDRKDLQVNKLKYQIEYLAHQNQCMRIQLGNKEQEIRKINQELRSRQNHIEEGNEILENLKKAYEAKISKLLEQLKRKIKNDVNASMEKNKNRFQASLTPVKIKGGISFSKMDEEQISTQYSKESKAHSTASRTLINSPYLQRVNLNNLESRIDRFRAETERTETQQQSYETQNNNEKILNKFENSIKKNKKIDIKTILQKLSEKMDKFSQTE